MTQWSFMLYSDADHSQTKELGVVSAASMEQAMRRGFFMFVSVGFNASDYSAQHFGGDWKDYPEAFFSVHEVHEDFEAEAKHFTSETF